MVKKAKSLENFEYDEEADKKSDDFKQIDDQEYL